MTDYVERDATKFWTEFLKTRCKRQIAEIGREYPFKRSLFIDYRDVEKSGHEGIQYADEIMTNPGKVLEDVWDAINAGQLIRMKDDKIPKVNVRIISLPRKTRIRDIRADDVNTFFSCEVLLTGVSEVRPRLIEAVFRCSRGHFTHKQQKFGKFTEPTSCATDGCTVKKLDLIPARSRFVDSQTARIQENLEGQRPGEQPQQLSVDIEDDLCGILVPGERAILNGILRSQQRTVKGEKSTVFDIFLQVNSIERSQKGYSEIECNEEEEAEILKLAKSPDILSVISQSILPAISGFEEEKKGLALSLFSPQQDVAPGGKKLRGSIHVFIGGDPGISKTTLLLMLHDLTPRSVYISGKSTSAAGLTFTMRQDEHDKRWVADAGAAVMADGSNLNVDELALMEKGDIMSLIEFMETQTITVAKAGIHQTLQARCAVTIAVNPHGGHFDMSGAPLADQIDPKIPPQVLSRCDLIYLIPDVPTETRDRKEAEDILGLWQGTMDAPSGQIPIALLQKYIAMAKRRKNPKMTDAAKRTIIDRFVDIRKGSQNGTIAITKRSLETLARLATAHALMRFGEEVAVKDAEVAIKVLDYSLKQVTFDNATGRYDADRVTGKTKEKLNITEDIKHAIATQGGTCLTDVILREVKAKHPNMEDNRIRNTIEQMHREGVLMEVSHNKWRVI